MLTNAMDNNHLGAFRRAGEKLQQAMDQRIIDGVAFLGAIQPKQGDGPFLLNLEMGIAFARHDGLFPRIF
jgi:hypothetical protein